ncbi:hypothetical protein I6M56_06165 [Shewanella algae]|uniref:hypothetical protein n=1 Tax=Shewanella algae TaxID=38313 RepID=UPI001AAC504E|nr:hypothetical protein [Shewanella algae]MBO2678448.1 hypothetical protein [Shewanella algae]
MSWDVIPETAKALVSWLPTKDNHKFNIMADIVSALGVAAYGSAVYFAYEPKLASSETAAATVVGEIKIALAFWGLFFVICWLTTFFKKND